MTAAGIVIIGRNEGERLARCIHSVVAQSPPAVIHPANVPHLPITYVDSGSSDGSPQAARTRGLNVIQLDPKRPFSAACARNEGFAALRQANPDLQVVQFIDGDCELQSGWLDVAERFLAEHPDAAVVCGRRRERFPTASIYNLLCDMEWNTPIGKTNSCGGDAMIRASAFAAVGGFDASLIAGEEPELCLRLRNAGWTIHRIDAEMTIHDADMHRFSQWWRRSQRAGFAFAAGARKGLKAEGGRRKAEVGSQLYSLLFTLHSCIFPDQLFSRSAGHWLREVARTWLWAVLVPVLALILAWWTHGCSLLILLAWIWPLSRAFFTRRSRGDSVRDAFAYSIFCLIGKWAELTGQLQFLAQLCGRSQQIIEYKNIPERPVVVRTQI